MSKPTIEECIAGLQKTQRFHAEKHKERVLFNASAEIEASIVFLREYDRLQAEHSHSSSESVGTYCDAFAAAFKGMLHNSAHSGSIGSEFGNWYIHGNITPIAYCPWCGGKPPAKQKMERTDGK